MDELKERNVIPVLSDFDKSISLQELKGVIHLRIIELEEEMSTLNPMIHCNSYERYQENKIRVAELKKLLGEEPKQITVRADAVTKID